MELLHHFPAFLLQIGHQSMIGKGIAAIADDQMVKELDLHQRAEQVQGAGQMAILGRGVEAAGVR